MHPITSGPSAADLSPERESLTDSLTASLIERYAAAAAIHAWEHHALQLHGLPSRQALEAVDTILNAEFEAQVNSQRDALVACYGAWFGQFVVTALGANWTGLFEADPPRLQLGTTCYSPFDAVARRLSSASAATLQVNYEQAVEKYSTGGLEDKSTYDAGGLGDKSASGLLRINEQAWDELARNSRFINVLFPSTAAEATEALDPWLIAEGVANKKVLCLAAAGGTHAPRLARAGAQVTLVDLSAGMLAIDRHFAGQSQLPIEIHQASIEDLSCLPGATYDIAVQPVSMSYLASPQRVYREVARVLRPDGLYIAQHKNPLSMQCVFSSQIDGYRLTNCQGVAVSARSRLAENSSAANSLEDGTTEMAHSLDALLGELCRAGFRIEDLQEPPRGDAWASAGSAAHQALFVPPYLKVKARRGLARVAQIP